MTLQTVTLTHSNPDQPTRDTLRCSQPETPRKGTPVFAGSPGPHDAIQCPAVLSIPSSETPCTVRKKVSGTFSCRRFFLDQSEQFPVFQLRLEAIEILQHGLFCVRVRIKFLHHAATHQFRTAFIQFALFLPELFLDGTEFLLERILLLLLLLDQLLFLRQKFSELLIGIWRFFSWSLFQNRGLKSLSSNLDWLPILFR